jgi:hypothetical protein
MFLKKQKKRRVRRVIIPLCLKKNNMKRVVVTYFFFFLSVSAVMAQQISSKLKLSAETKMFILPSSFQATAIARLIQLEWSLTPTLLLFASRSAGSFVYVHQANDLRSGRASVFSLGLQQRVALYGKTEFFVNGAMNRMSINIQSGNESSCPVYFYSGGAGFNYWLNAKVAITGSVNVFEGRSLHNPNGERKNDRQLGRISVNAGFKFKPLLP